jgi:hypothetical protein
MMTAPGSSRQIEGREDDEKEEEKEEEEEEAKAEEKAEAKAEVEAEAKNGEDNVSHDTLGGKETEMPVITHLRASLRLALAREEETRKELAAIMMVAEEEVSSAAKASVREEDMRREMQDMRAQEKNIRREMREMEEWRSCEESLRREMEEVATQSLHGMEEVATQSLQRQCEVDRLRYTLVSKETWDRVKRDLGQCQRRPNIET